MADKPKGLAVRAVGSAEAGVVLAVAVEAMGSRTGTTLPRDGAMTQPIREARRISIPREGEVLEDSEVLEAMEVDRGEMDLEVDRGEMDLGADRGEMDLEADREEMVSEVAADTKGLRAQPSLEVVL